MIVEVIKKLSSIGEVIAGSKEERRLVDLIKETFEGVADDVRVVPVDVLNWQEKSVSVSCNAKALSLTYSPSGAGEAKVIEVKSLFEIPKLYSQAIEEGVEAVAFTTNDGTLRRFVLKRSPFLQYYGEPPPIPAVFLDRRPNDETCYVEVETKFAPSVGYNVEAVRAGKTDELVYVTAHHDHFLSGEHDDLAGVALLPFIKNEKRTLKLVSLTAEESGCYFDTLSWGCGARAYVSSLRDSPKFVVDLDFLDPTSVLFVSPGLFKSAVGVVESRIPIERRPQAYTNSYAFLRKGIPTVTLSPKEEVSYYHSNKDVVEPQEEELLERFVNVVSGLVDSLEFNESEILEDVRELLESLPLEVRLKLVMGLSPQQYLSSFRMVMKTGRARDRPFGEILGIVESFFDKVTIEGLGEFSPPQGLLEVLVRIKILNEFLKNEFEQMNI